MHATAVQSEVDMNFQHIHIYLAVINSVLMERISEVQGFQ
jgi:hypothetical protein